MSIATPRYLLQNNNNNSAISLSEAEITIVMERLLKKGPIFIVLLVKLVGFLIKKTVNSSSFLLESFSKYVETLEKIAFLRQNLIDKVSLKKIHNSNDLLMEMKEITENVVEPLKTLRYWETEIKRQLLQSVQDFFSKSSVASNLAINPVPSEVSKSVHFFQLKAAAVSSSEQSIQLDQSLAPI